MSTPSRSRKHWALSSEAWRTEQPSTTEHNQCISERTRAMHRRLPALSNCREVTETKVPLLEGPCAWPSKLKCKIDGADVWAGGLSSMWAKTRWRAVLEFSLERTVGRGERFVGRSSVLARIAGKPMSRASASYDDGSSDGQAPPVVSIRLHRNEGRCHLLPDSWNQS